MTQQEIEFFMKLFGILGNFSLAAAVFVIWYLDPRRHTKEEKKNEEKKGEGSEEVANIYAEQYRIMAEQQMVAFERIEGRCRDSLQTLAEDHRRALQEINDRNMGMFKVLFDGYEKTNADTQKLIVMNIEHQARLTHQVELMEKRHG